MGASQTGPARRHLLQGLGAAALMAGTAGTAGSASAAATSRATTTPPARTGVDNRVRGELRGLMADL